MADSINNTSVSRKATAEDFAAMKFDANPNVWKNIPNNTDFVKDAVHIRIASRIIAQNDVQIENMVNSKTESPEIWCDVIEALQFVADRNRAYAELCESATARLLCGLSRI